MGCIPTGNVQLASFQAWSLWWAMDRALPPLLDRALPTSLDKALPPLLYRTLPPLLDRVLPPLLNRVLSPLLDRMLPSSLERALPPLLNRAHPPSLDRMFHPSLDRALSPSLDRVLPHSLALSGRGPSSYLNRHLQQTGWNGNISLFLFQAFLSLLPILLPWSSPLHSLLPPLSWKFVCVF